MSSGDTPERPDSEHLDSEHLNSERPAPGHPDSEHLNSEHPDLGRPKSPPSPPETAASVGRSGALMAAGTLTSRILGMVKGVMITAILGTGITSGTFDVANTIPNNLYLLLAGGVLGAVLVPQITKAASHDDGGEDFVNRLLTLSLVIMAVATIALTALAPVLIRVYGSPLWGANEFALATAFAFICLPQIFFYGLYTLLGQVLNARGRFAAYMWAPVLANVVTIAALLAYLMGGMPRQPRSGEFSAQMMWLIAGGTTLGIIVQGLVLIIPLRRMGFRYRPVWGFRGVGLGTASKVAIWTFAALAVSQLGFVLTSQVLTYGDHLAEVAGVFGAGKVPYSNAFLLFMLPHSMITVSIVTALFTQMSKSAHVGDHRGVVDNLGTGLRMASTLIIPASIGGMVLAPLITRTLYVGTPHGGTDAIARVLIAMLAGLAPTGWLYLTQRAFYAYEDAKTPFWLQIIVTLVASAANVAAFWLPAQWTGVGVGVGQSVSNLVAALIGFRLLRVKLGPLGLRPVIQQNVRLLIASLVAAALTVAAHLGLSAVLGDGWIPTLVILLVSGGLFVALALGGAARLHVTEVSQLAAPVLRRVSRNRA